MQFHKNFKPHCGRLSECIQQNSKKINLSVGFPRNPRSSGFAVNSWKFLLQPDLPDYGNAGCGVTNGGYIITQICLRINILKENYFENWVNGEVSKSAKSPNLLTFKVIFLSQKLSKSFSIFFFIEEYQFRSTFFVIDIF